MQSLLDAVSSDKSDDDYSVLADKIFKRQPAECVTVNSINQTTQPFDPLQELRDEVQQLKQLLQTYVSSSQSTSERTTSQQRDSKDICY